MTTQEFSDAFDTLLASYNHKAEFGDLSSYADVTLDEYEKSVFLTQALDNVVKNYFARQTNSLGEGFDDSTRRLVDFSSLIKVASLEPTALKTIKTDVEALVPTGITTPPYVRSNIGTATVTNNSGSPLRVILIVRPHLGVNEGVTVAGHTTDFSMSDDMFGTNTFEDDGVIVLMLRDWQSAEDLEWCINENVPLFLDVNGKITINFNLSSHPDLNYLSTAFDITLGAGECFDERGIIFDMPKTASGGTDVLFILNEKIQCTIAGRRRDFVVVPISYKEYDREMSRPFAQPLKKLAWRLFLNGSLQFNVLTELIMKDNIMNVIDSSTPIVYKIRYVKRPKPIVLEDLPNNLSVDGVSIETPCELNPILHIDILEEAVRLALNSKGIETRDLKAAREAAKNRHN